jgi:DNA processing protein
LNHQKYWLGFSLIPDIGPKRSLQLLHAFGGLQAAWEATHQQLVQAGLPVAVADGVLAARSRLNLERELERVRRVDAFLLTLVDDQYPPLLRDVDDAPALIYVRGELYPQDRLAVCVVGTRKPTLYGKDAAYQLARNLAANGVTIVSGLAQGIDAAAHRGALDAGGRTIGVMGNGISDVYPHDSLPLAREIIRSGAVVTEFPIGTAPTARNFPRRNRVMSGLSLGVLVVEAGEKSGALITARHAAEQGRDVYAVPSNIFNAEGRGTNRLIQDGAKLVMSVADVLEEIEVTHTLMEASITTKETVPPTDDEAHLLQLLSNDPIHIDDLVRASGLPVATVSSMLTILELKGLARAVGRMQYSLPQ